MNRRSFFVAGAVVLLPAVFAITPAFAQDHAKDKVYLLNAYKKIDAATNKKDLKGWAVFMHPDFTDINTKGKTTLHSKKEAEAQYADIFAHADNLFLQTTVTGVTFTNEGALVKSRSKNGFTFTNNGKTQKVMGTAAYEDLWVKSGDKWLVKRSRTTKESTLMNGKPVPSA